MNTKRIVVLGLAMVAALAAVLLVRGMLGGGTPKVEAKAAPAVAMSEVLVASGNLQPGQTLSPDQVRWQAWPRNAVDSSFITRDNGGDLSDAVKDTVVRAPLLAGQPVTTTAVVHGDSAGFMAAMLNPGMRAVSITISADSGAGGFILPNDRVDVILTVKVSNGTMAVARARTLLDNVRVLAVDQTFKQDKNTKTVIGKTATLELTPVQAQLVAQAQGVGTLSLALRPLTDGQDAVASNEATDGKSDSANNDAPADSVSVIRYGIAHGGSDQGRVQ